MNDIDFDEDELALAESYALRSDEPASWRGDFSDHDYLDESAPCDCAPYPRSPFVALHMLLARLVAPAQGVWQAVRSRFVRCDQCGRTLRECDCIPF